MENSDILRPILLGFVLGVITFLVQFYTPYRAKRRAEKNGKSLEECNQVYQNEELRLHQLNKGNAVYGGWYILAIILAIKGGYPAIAVTLSWIMVFSTFIFRIIQFNTLRDSNKGYMAVLGIVAMIVAIIMFVSLVWLTILTFEAVF